MRISDWSSDVCSSDLAGAERSGGARGSQLVALRATFAAVRDYKAHRAAYDRGETRDYGLSPADLEALVPGVEGRMPLRSEARRGGKGWGSPGRPRWSPYD